jgi:hypothetical protein
MELNEGWRKALLAGFWSLGNRATLRGEKRLEGQVLYWRYALCNECQVAETCTDRKTSARATYRVYCFCNSFAIVCS